MHHDDLIFTVLAALTLMLLVATLEAGRAMVLLVVGLWRTRRR